MSVLFCFVQAVQAKQSPSQCEMARAKAWGKFQCFADDRLSLNKILLIAKKRAQSEMRFGIMAATSVDGFLKRDRKSTRLNSSHGYISYAVFCLKKKKKK